MGASFSRDGTRAAVLSDSTILVYDLARLDMPEIVKPLAIWRPINLSGDPFIHSIGFRGESKDLVWLTVNTTEEKVKGKVLPLAEYETLVCWDGKLKTRYYMDETKYSGVRPIFLTRGFTFSGDGKHLLLGAGSRLMRWDVPASGQPTDPSQVQRFDDQVECLACSPDNTLVALGYGSRRLTLYPLNNDSELPLFEFKEHGAIPRALAFVDNQHIVSGDSRGQILVWTIPKDMKIEPTKIVPTDNPHKEAVTCVAGVVPYKRYATGSKDGFVRVGELVEGKTLHIEQFVGEEIRALGFSAKGTHLNVLTDKQLLRITLGSLPSPALVRIDEGDETPRGVAKKMAIKSP